MSGYSNISNIKLSLVPVKSFEKLTFKNKSLIELSDTKDGNLFLVERYLIVKEGFFEIHPSLLHNLKYDVLTLESELVKMGKDL